MEESKVTNMTLSMTIAGSEGIINDYLKNEKPKWLATCRKVTKHTRAGKDGNYKDCNYNLDEYFYEYEFNSIREETD